MAEDKIGSIVCVGTGMTLGSHISPLSRSYIEQADVVFCSMSDKYVEEWITTMNSDVRSLQHYYQEGKDRRITYREMVEAMLQEVRAGKKVVGAFYGHPGVFAWAPHKIIEQARMEGYQAHMEPGVSAEACLYADLGIDPGKTGCQHFEATQFMLYERTIDPAAYLILWQVGIAGDQSTSRFSTSSQYRKVLRDLLLNTYPAEHKVALYEAPTLPIHNARIDWLPLDEFASVAVNQHTTMAIPPAEKMRKNKTMFERLTRIRNSYNS